MASNSITNLVERFVRIEEDKLAAKNEAKKAGYDPAALRRAALWDPATVLKRQVQAAVDHQIRHLAGRESEPATIPPESDLAKVAKLHAKGMSARAIADRLGCGKTKAHKLMQQAELFGVRPNADADSASDG